MNIENKEKVCNIFEQIAQLSKELEQHFDVDIANLYGGEDSLILDCVYDIQNACEKAQYYL